MGSAIGCHHGGSAQSLYAHQFQPSHPLMQMFCACGPIPDSCSMNRRAASTRRSSWPSLLFFAVQSWSFCGAFIATRLGEKNGSRSGWFLCLVLFLLRYHLGRKGTTAAVCRVTCAPACRETSASSSKDMQSLRYSGAEKFEGKCGTWGNRVFYVQVCPRRLRTPALDEPCMTHVHILLSHDLPDARIL